VSDQPATSARAQSPLARTERGDLLDEVGLSFGHDIELEDDGKPRDAVQKTTGQLLAQAARVPTSKARHERSEARTGSAVHPSRS